jgi:hypothetical protein
MAATLEQMMNFAKQNPDTDYAKTLFNHITSGQADNDARKEGIDLTSFGRPSFKQEKPKESLAERIGNFTGGTKIGQGIGQALNQGAAQKQIEDAQLGQQDMTKRIIDTIHKNKAEGKDTTHLERTLSDLGVSIGETGRTAEQQLNPYGLTSKQVIGDALQIGTTLAGAATLPGTAQAATEAVGLGKGALQGFAHGAMEGTALGTVGGLAGGLKEDHNLDQLGTDALQGGLMGGLTGGVVGGVTGGISGFVKGRPNQLTKSIDAVSPNESGKKLAAGYKEVATGNRTVKPGTIFGEQTLSPSVQSKNLGARLNDLGLGKDSTKNLKILGKALDDTETEISGALKQGDFVKLDKNGLLTKLEEAKSAGPREFRSMKESQATYDNVLDYAKELVAKAKDNISGGRDARKAFDMQAMSDFPSAYKEGHIDISTPAGRAIKVARDVINEHTYDVAPSGSGLRDLIGREADIFRAIENIAPKAAKGEGKNVVGQIMSKYPRATTAAGTIATIAGAGKGYDILTK